MDIQELGVKGAQFGAIGSGHKVKDAPALVREPNHYSAPVGGVAASGYQASFHRPINQQRRAMVAELQAMGDIFNGHRRKSGMAAHRQ